MNIHGCLAKISEFPPTHKKEDIINKTNQQLKNFKDLHVVHTDRLQLVNPDDEKTLLLLTPNLMAVSPQFVDHLPDPICYTMFFQPDPTTLSFNNQNLHKAHIPTNLLASLTRAPYLITPTTKISPRKTASFDKSGLDNIFNQWCPSHNQDPSTPIPTQTLFPRKGTAHTLSNLWRAAHK
jgi:hypothetical protein